MTDQAEDLKTLMKNKNNGNKSLSNLPPKRKTRIIAVTSGKGGVGKTNIMELRGRILQKMSTH